MVDQKTVPQAPEIEEGVLGACLTDPTVFNEIKELIRPDVFFSNRNRLIYEKCLNYESPDLIMIETDLKEESKLNEVGGVAYLSGLLVNATTRHEAYCQILNEKKIKRDIIYASQNLMEKAYNGENCYSLMDEFSRASVDIGSSGTEKKSFTPSEIIERDKTKPKAEKLFLGLSDLDQGIYEHGMRRGQLELTIADSGHGKTQYALFKAECLLRRGYRVAWFQLEGTDSETARYIMESGINAYDNIHICDKLYDIEDIKRESRRLNREHGIDYIVYDYVQNIECNQKISRTEKVEYISKNITRLAKELNTYNHALSQITMNYTARSGWSQEPSYGDVRWSQQLKQDAAIITSVFRPLKVESLVLNQEEVKDWNDNPVPYDSVFVKQAKVRHGRQEWKRLHMIHTDKGLKPYSVKHGTKKPF